MRLIQGYLEDSLTQHESVRLLTLLRQDPSFVGLILDDLRTDCLIHAVLAEAPGKIEATVVRQRPFQPMTLTTPNAEARVLGTRFALMVTTNATRLDVTEGNVRFTRASDGTAVKVGAGYYAVVAAGMELATLPITGRVLREVWRDVQGNEVHDLTLHLGFPDRPDQRDFPAALETLHESNDTFGVRLRGYLTPDKTDDYAFSLSASGAAALWLSEDDSPQNRVKIAQASAVARSGAPVSRSFTPTQRQSAPVRLERGRRYYLEVQHVHVAGQNQRALRIVWTQLDKNRRKSHPSAWRHS